MSIFLLYSSDNILERLADILTIKYTKLNPYFDYTFSRMNFRLRKTPTSPKGHTTLKTSELFLRRPIFVVLGKEGFSQFGVSCLLVLLFAEGLDALADAQISREVDNHHLGVETDRLVGALFCVVSVVTKVHGERYVHVFRCEEIKSFRGIVQSGGCNS